MKTLMTLLMIAAATMIGVAVFANVSDTTSVLPTISTAAVSSYTYTVSMLFLLATAGILLHWLVDFQKAKKQNVNCNVRDYMKSTGVSSLTSLVICIIVILLRHELTNRIPSFSWWEGTAMVIVGYAGDSILPVVFGFAKSKGINLEKEQ